MNNDIQLLCTQLEILNERIRMYAGRIWQLPVIYFSGAAISIINIDKFSIGTCNYAISIFFLLAGILISSILFSYRKRINDLVGCVVKIEETVNIKEVSSVIKMGFWSFCLYLLIVIGGIIVAMSPMIKI